VTDAETTRTPTPPQDESPPGADTSMGADTAAGVAPVPSGAGGVPPSGTPPSAPAPSPAPSQGSTWRSSASDSGRNASLIFGAIVLIVGLWFFATRTLGLDLPEVDWGQFWPLILIALGAWIVLNAMRRRAD
jgi:cell wall-active antibiotic response 4TMS protein YvqF